jgi:hypothetical protein
MEPEVRNFIFCDEVHTDPSNNHRINVFGLISSIRSTAEPPFPVVRPLLCAVVLFTAPQGIGEFVLRIVHDRTRRVIFRSPPRQVRFVGGARAVRGCVFRIRNCSFQVPGVYWGEVLFNGSIIARQKIDLRP